MARVALATATDSGWVDPDEVPLLDALIWSGVDASVVAWDDRSVDWAAFDLVVIRSTWDYTRREREFARWLHRVERRTRLANRATLVEWNIDKRYLRDLAAGGVPVVPTTFVEPGDLVRIPERGEIVVKPVISAGAVDTRRYELPAQSAEAHAHVDALLGDGRSAMIQPFLSAVDDNGEIDLVYLGGTYSHAVRRVGALPAPGAEPLQLPVEEGAVAAEPDAAQRAVADHARRVLAQRDDADLLYARVDLVDGMRGEPLVLEVELAEPALYLTTAEGAVERFADAIAQRLGRG